MARKLVVRGPSKPSLDEMSSDGTGVVFQQPITNQAVPTGYPTLDNPVREPPIDRKHMRGFRPELLGFQRRSENFNDLSVGEAGAGVSQFRRAQFFSRIAGALDFADLFDYNEPIAIATAKAADVRPRFWHISFFAVSALSGGLAAGPSGPLTQGEILSTAGKEPTNTVLKGRIQVYDESGSRFYDVNIHGTSSFSFYGWGVTTFILLPTLNGVSQASEVDVQNPALTPDTPGLHENTLATGRIIPTFQNVTQITDQVTRTTTAPSGVVGGFGVLPIPPGARAVRIRANVGVAPGALSPGYEINFAVAPGAGRPLSLGHISLLPGRLESSLVAVPNATFIAFRAVAPADPEVEWIATFIVEA